MTPITWVRFFPSDWLAGTRGMTAAETGVYITLVAMMYDNGEPIADRPDRLARYCGMGVDEFQQVVDLLVGDGKLRRAEGYLWHERVEAELGRVQERSETEKRYSETQADRAKKRWHKKDNENNGTPDATAMPVESHGSAPAPKPVGEAPKPPKPVSRARRLTADWVLPVEWEDDAREIGLPALRIAEEAVKMRDWSISAPNGAKLDWRAAWRNWCRTALSRSRPAPRGDGQPTLSEAFGQMASLLQEPTDEHSRTAGTAVRYLAGP